MNFIKKLLSGNPSKKETQEETTETKKCKKCLRRVKITFDVCPYCESMDFDYNT
jgi:ubiquitin